LPTYHIHIDGLVQGVGFRPFVYQLASQYQLRGWVSNGCDGVHIELNVSEEIVADFLDDVKNNAPTLARIANVTYKQVPDKQYESFEIVESQSEGIPNLLLTPDVALCASCRTELHDNTNRRAYYAFITCTQCGPRFSIKRQLPYDRENTTMAPFSMCESCEEEYLNPLDRRYFSQTNSCLDCGVWMNVIHKGIGYSEATQDEMLEMARASIHKGEIIAVKGIGGYLLMCDARNATAIQKLRTRKHRPIKPFALMYPDLELLAQDTFLNPEAREMLLGPVSPLVLLKTRVSPPSGICTSRIAPGLNEVGVMLPYTPLFECMLSELKFPVIATSGNRSHFPIAFRDEQAVDQLGDIAELILSHNREIAIPQDDSVVGFAQKASTPLIFRRSRGLAPTYFRQDGEQYPSDILAMGSDMKNTFTMSHHQEVYISPYLGDLQNWDTQQHVIHTRDHLINLLEAQPRQVLIDQHPEYFSAKLGREYAAENHLPLSTIQHHEAHFAAVLGEHQLLNSEKPVLGVIWDGTGWGTDQQIWGGEFFRYQSYSFQRCCHMQYFPHIAGNQFARLPKLAALSLLQNIPKAQKILKPRFSPGSYEIYLQLLANSRLMTSSMGRMFDAVAGLLGICTENTFEGEAAMKLEACARQFSDRLHVEDISTYPFYTLDNCAVPFQMIAEGILRDMTDQYSASHIAAKFHKTLVVLIREIARREKIHKIAFSGGVFQNRLLIDLIYQLLGADFELYFHRQLSPNDENISFGQLVHYTIHQTHNLKEDYYVFSHTR